MVRIGNICLPFEILSKIFKMLPQKDKIKLRQVCEEFKRLVDHSYFNKGFNFRIKKDSGPHLLRAESKTNDFHYAPVKAIRVFKISTMAFGNLMNHYEMEDLKMSHPESVKNLIFGGYMTPINFAIILKQLTRLTLVCFTHLVLENLQQDHMSGLNFNYLECIMIDSGENFLNTPKIKTLLTENEFPKLIKAFILLSFKPRPNIHDKKITPEEDFEVREKILFPFLKKCQKTIVSFKIKEIPIRAEENVLDFNPVEEDENLNLEEYKIFCPYLRTFNYTHLNGAKIDPWITFLETNFSKLISLEWANKSDIQEDQEAFQNLIKSQKWANLKILIWENYSSPYLSEVDFIFLKNYEFLKLLKIRNFPTGMGENWNFKNLKLIPKFCPDLEFLTLGRCRMNSDIIDHLLTGKNLPKLKIVRFLSEWRGVGNGMRVDTFRKVVEEKKIEILILMDCVDKESFGQDENKDFIISQIGQDLMEHVQISIQNWQPIIFSWMMKDENNNDN